MTPTFSLDNMSNRFTEDGLAIAAQTQRIVSGWARHFERIAQDHGARQQKLWTDLQRLMGGFSAAAGGRRLFEDARDYAVDAWQRGVLTLDVLRERGNNDAAHAAAGTPPVLIYANEIVLDGRTLARPVNYLLLRILPPAGIEVFDWKRPYMIIDPRAGHGAGIGGFKAESQVGVALRDGHPVYFVAFQQHPEPGQTLADVMRAEAAFVEEIHRRHPDAPKPIIVGNCQGGWATLVLAAANPDITGPLVINGAPVACWSGHIGGSPMRYNGGLCGGATASLLMADLGNGEFDGAHLVGNFEALNPGRNFFGKYFDLYADVDKAREGFLAFERWWGGFHFMNEAEIRWIVEQLFVGNRLARGEAMLEHGRHLDLKAIRSPIIVFASWGDNITPPPQALNWIADTYADEQEIKIRGQRIIYMVHDKVGHLGIFVSSAVARKEHTEVTSTLKMIEALAPGLYEMTIEEQIGEGQDAHFRVGFIERKMSDLKAFDENRDEERNFAAVARLSELGAEVYDLTVRPYVQAMITPALADAIRRAHPSRVRRRMFSDENPFMRPVAAAASAARADRKPASADNPFVALEKWWAAGVVQAFDVWRDLRDAFYETAFLAIYGAPVMSRLAASHAFERTRKDPKALRYLPEVQAAMLGLARGGFEEAVIRMLILLAESRGEVRRDRLERSARVLNRDEPFAALGPERRAALIREQGIIVQFAPDWAIAALPELLRDTAQRRKAMDVVEFIAGSYEEMEPEMLQTLQQMHEALDLPAIVLPGATPDPLTESEFARDVA